MLYQPHHWQLSQCEADEPRIVNCFMQRSLRMFKMFSKCTELAIRGTTWLPTILASCLQFPNVCMFVYLLVYILSADTCTSARIYLSSNQWYPVLAGVNATVGLASLI